MKQNYGVSKPGYSLKRGLLETQQEEKGLLENIFHFQMRRSLELD